MAELLLDDLRASNTFERKLLERLVDFVNNGGSIPVTVRHEGPDLSEVWARFAALEARPVSAPVEFGPVLDGIANLADRVAGLEVAANAPREAPSTSFDPAPIALDVAALREGLTTAERRHMDQERSTQAIVQILKSLEDRVSRIDADITALALVARQFREVA